MSFDLIYSSYQFFCSARGQKLVDSTGSGLRLFGNYLCAEFQTLLWIAETRKFVAATLFEDLRSAVTLLCCKIRSRDGIGGALWKFPVDDFDRQINWNCSMRKIHVLWRSKFWAGNTDRSIVATFAWTAPLTLVCCQLVYICIDLVQWQTTGMDVLLGLISKRKLIRCESHYGYRLLHDSIKTHPVNPAASSIVQFCRADREICSTSGVASSLCGKASCWFKILSESSLIWHCHCVGRHTWFAVTKIYWCWLVEFLAAIFHRAFALSIFGIGTTKVSSCIWFFCCLHVSVLQAFVPVVCNCLVGQLLIFNSLAMTASERFYWINIRKNRHKN